VYPWYIPVMCVLRYGWEGKGKNWMHGSPSVWSDTLPLLLYLYREDWHLTLMGCPGPLGPWRPLTIPLLQACVVVDCFHRGGGVVTLLACSFGLSATSQQYFSLRTNQPPAISQQYFSLRTNQHQPNEKAVCLLRILLKLCHVNISSSLKI
jgi:hypothetical protein